MVALTAPAAGAAAGAVAAGGAAGAVAAWGRTVIWAFAAGAWTAAAGRGASRTAAGFSITGAGAVATAGRSNAIRTLESALSGADTWLDTSRFEADAVSRCTGASAA